MAVLRETGPVPGDENGVNGKYKKTGAGKDDETSRKRKRGGSQTVSYSLSLSHSRLIFSSFGQREEELEILRIAGLIDGDFF